ncbi:hypothetical protein FOZ61_009824 [Perkinsus olseni]|nr:hypothetical protein FOZ61_009824 [Perkinsus olseni]
MEGQPAFQSSMKEAVHYQYSPQARMANGAGEAAAAAAPLSMTLQQPPSSFSSSQLGHEVSSTCVPPVENDSLENGVDWQQHGEGYYAGDPDQAEHFEMEATMHHHHWPSYDDQTASFEEEAFPDTENGTPVATYHSPQGALPPPRFPPAMFLPQHMQHHHQPLLLPPPPGVRTGAVNSGFYAPMGHLMHPYPPLWWHHHQNVRMYAPATNDESLPEGSSVGVGESNGPIPQPQAAEAMSAEGPSSVTSEEGEGDLKGREKLYNDLTSVVEAAFRLEKRRIRAKYRRRPSPGAESGAQTTTLDTSPAAVQTLLDAIEMRAAAAQTVAGATVTCSSQTERKTAVDAETQAEVTPSGEEDARCSSALKELQSRSETQLMELQAKNTKLRDLQRAKSSLELRIRQLESERDQLQASRKDLSNQLKAADRKVKALGSSNRDIQASMEKSTKEHISVIMAMQNEVAGLEKKVQEVNEKLKEKTEEHVATQRVVDMFKIEVRKWQGEARRVQQRQVQLASCSRCIGYTKLEKAYADLQKEFQLEQNRYAAASKAREEMKEKFRDYVSPDREGQLLREIENLNAMHEVDQRSLRKEIAHIKEERDRMRNQLADESHRSSKLMAELQEARRGVQKTPTSADAWLVEQLDSAAQQYSTEVSELRSQTAKLKSELKFAQQQCGQESDKAKMYTSLLEDAELEKERYRLKMLEAEEALRRLRRDATGNHKRLGETPPVSVGHAASQSSPCKSVSQYHCAEVELEVAVEAYPKKSPTKKPIRAWSSDEDEESAFQANRASLRR